MPKSKKGRASYLQVGNPTENQLTRVEWKEGVPILFDDSFVHSAVHAEDDSEGIMDGARIVLILDFFHPALAEADRTALGVLYPPGS